jgi:hypothetical protein
MNPKPGNQPDPNDMADASAEEGETVHHVHPDTVVEEAEEEAARLGDFA